MNSGWQRCAATGSCEIYFCRQSDCHIFSALFTILFLVPSCSVNSFRGESANIGSPSNGGAHTMAADGRKKEGAEDLW